MRKCIIIAILLFLINRNNISLAQSNVRTYQIQSIDSKESKLKIWDHFEEGIIRITYLKDTINIYESTGIDKTEILDNNFIKINYRSRGGSDVAVGNVVIVCVDNNKLYEAAHIEDYIKWAVHGEKADDHIKLSLTGSNKKDYKLNIDVYDSFISKEKPQSNYNYHNLSVLKFDINYNVFYSLKKDVYNDFAVYNAQTYKEDRKHVAGNYPVIIIGEENYYYIKNEWYSVGTNNHLNQYSSRSGN